MEYPATQPLPSHLDIEAAYRRIGKSVRQTPIEHSTAIDRIAGCSIYFKCENMQKAGAFKYRGATNAILQLRPDEMAKGVATHSSGNHAAALSLAAQKKGIPAYIVMPETAPEIKKKAVESYGGIITLCEPNLKARETTLAEIIQKNGATFIHPYDNRSVICGQGTVSLELLAANPNLDIVIAPVGGGGLHSGTATYVKGRFPHITVLRAEPLEADDAFRSLRDHKLYPSVNPQTIADGLLTALSPLTFTICRKHCDGIITATEKGIVRAMRLIWERLKVIIEPSSAVPLAAILEHPEHFKGKRVGIILSGGNIDLDKLPW